MSTENPTLKVRFQVDDPMLGLDCHQFAAEIAAANGRVVVLDAKWGRKPSVWRDTGGWGRVRLTDWQRGFIAACERDDVTSVERHLVDIIKGIAK